MSSRAAVKFAVPRWTVTPEANSATYHFREIAGPVTVRSNRSVLGLTIRPETWLAPGFTSSNEALNVRKDCVVTTAPIVTSTEVAAAPRIAEPFWTLTLDAEGVEEVSGATSTSDRISRAPSSACAPAIPVDAPRTTCSDWTGKVNVPALEKEDRCIENASTIATINPSRANRVDAARLWNCGSMGIPSRRTGLTR